MQLPYRALWLSALAAACSVLVACGGSHAAAPGGQFQFKPQVTVVTLRAQSVNLTRELPGRTAPFLVAEVRPQVSGIVKRRLFTEGAYVKAGQPLYELDDAIYRAQYDSAQAALLKARATLDAARLAAKRSAELVKVDAVSAQDNDNAIAAERQAEADVAAAQAAVESGSINVAYAHIASPISGRIGKSDGHAGRAGDGQPGGGAGDRAASSIRSTSMSINRAASGCSFSARSAPASCARARARPPRSCSRTAASIAHEGKLQFADVTVEQSTGNFLLRVLVPNPDQLLMPGMYVRARASARACCRTGCWCRSRASPTIRRVSATALVVAANGTVEQRMVKATRADR